MSEQWLLFLVDLLAIFGIYLTLNLSLRLQLGYTGIANFGLVLSFTGGAYVAGWLPVRMGMRLFRVDSSLAKDMIWNNVIINSQINQSLQQNPSMAMGILIATLLVAAAIGALLGLLSGYPAVRLGGDYLAISLLALGEVLAIIGGNYEPLVGGPLGVQVPDVWAWSLDHRFAVASLANCAMALVVWVYLSAIERSPMGRVLRAVRDNPDAGASLGKDVTKIRLNVLVAGGIICSLAGAMYAFYTSGVAPSALGRFDWTFLPWVMVVFGGSGSNLGVLLGTFAFITLQKLIVSYKYALSFLPFDPVWLQYLLMGLVLLLILNFRPYGLIREKASYSTKPNNMSM
ncbi:branched-chain amino acid ABC transporter permease [Acetomicrobium sp. S15 = DSM 107314]|uniref:branched-chain amino acid ABC transporter permease n=1 Tax=Acetomicrobium sp. S15 = DSM 107314 TaxID=2529858 RepID=UPI0018E0D132|nr:branched-chain amino acid ABC transporter permease [Acetomicrobium sp. S15 = DSM 107314]